MSNFSVETKNMDVAGAKSSEIALKDRYKFSLGVYVKPFKFI